MSHSSHREQFFRFIIFCFFHLQICSAVYLLVYWGNIGVNPSGYFSFQDILVVSIDRSAGLSLMFLFYGVLYGLVFMVGHDMAYWKKVSYVLILPVDIVLLFVVIYYDPLESHHRTSFFAGVLIFLLKYPVEALSTSNRIYSAFGSSRAAFVYIFVALSGLMSAFYSASRDSHRDYDSAGPEMVTVELKGKLLSYPLINKIGSNFVVFSDIGEVVVFPHTEVKYVTYPSGI